MILGENIFAMLLVENFFKTFTDKPISDATRGTEVLVCLSCESRTKVDDLVAKAMLPEGALRESHRIKDSCTDMGLKILMATSGS